MSIRNTTECDAYIFTILQEGKGQGIAINFGLFHTQTR